MVIDINEKNKRNMIVHSAIKKISHCKRDRRKLLAVTVVVAVVVVFIVMKKERK